MKHLIILISIVLLPFTAFAQIDYCEGNFDHDLDVDGDDAALFKTDYGRNKYNETCPPSGPAPVPKTGQAECYDNSGTIIDCADTGQDGEHQKGVTWQDLRFTDNEDGTVTDNLTGLIWMKNANCFGNRHWNEGIEDCRGLSAGWCELTDGSQIGEWRLPNIKELLSLIDYGNQHPALPLGHPFANVVNDGGTSFYRTSSTNSATPTKSWCVRLDIPDVWSYDKTISIAYVWCVRGGH